MKIPNRFMKWFMKRHPLNSKCMIVRLSWIVFTLPIQIALFTAMAAFKASITFCEEMRDWWRSLSRATKKAIFGDNKVEVCDGNV